MAGGNLNYGTIGLLSDSCHSDMLVAARDNSSEAVLCPEALMIIEQPFGKNKVFLESRITIIKH